MQSWEPDDCCGRLIGKALAAGALDTATSWECPKCGMEWKPEEHSVTIGGEVHSVRHWRPCPTLLVL